MSLISSFLKRQRASSSWEYVKMRETRLQDPCISVGKQICPTQPNGALQHPNEIEAPKSYRALPELGQSIPRLADLAYPIASADIKETLVRDQFVDIKPAELWYLDDAIQLPV